MYDALVISNKFLHFLCALVSWFLCMHLTFFIVCLHLLIVEYFSNILKGFWLFLESIYMMVFRKGNTLITLSFFFLGCLLLSLTLGMFHKARFVENGQVK